MEFQQIDNSYIVYVEKGEKVMDTLTNFCINHNIYSGQISGIGAVENVDMGIYDIKAKEYHHKLFDNIHELTSFQSNITLKDNQPFIHAHITIGDHNMQVFGGHLFEMKVAAVGEFILHSFSQKIYRKIDDKIGLATLNLCKL